MHIAAIQKFLKDNEDKIQSKWTTSDFNGNIVKPQTEGTNEPYIELYKNTKDAESAKPLVASATVFISHAWKYEFVEVVVNVMKQHAQENPDAYFWFDLFTNDQNANNDKDADWYSTTFRESIKSIGHVLLILSPWNKPKPIKRAWCLFEIAHALRESDVKLEISLPNGEVEDMKVSAGENGHKIMEALSTIKAKEAKAKFDRDRNMIFASIEAFDGGFQKLDEGIKDRLREWYKQQLVRLSEENPSDAKLNLTVADVLKDFDDVQKALTHGERGLALIGRESPHTKHASQNGEKLDNAEYELWEDTMLTIAILYERVGNTPEALKVYQELLDHLKATRNENDFEIAKVLNNTAGIYRDRGDLKLAMDCHKKAIKIKIASKGEEAVTVGISHLNMGNVCLDLMELDTALDSYETAMRVFLKNHGDNHPRFAKCLANMGEVYYSLGKWRQCLEVQQKALEVKRTSIGRNHVETATTCNCIGRAHLEMDNIQKAMEFHREALDIQTKVAPYAHMDLAKTHRYIGEVFFKDSKYKEAQIEYQKSLDKHIKVSGRKPQTKEASRLYVNIGDCHFKQKNVELSLCHYVTARDIQEKLLGNEHPLTGMTYDKLAEFTMEAKGAERERKLEEALELAGKAKKIKLNRLNEHHPSVIKSYRIIADVYEAQKKTKEADEERQIIKQLEQTAEEEDHIEEALKNLKLAAEIREDRLGINHPDVAKLYENIMAVYKSIGRTLQAEKLQHDIAKRQNQQNTVTKTRDQ